MYFVPEEYVNLVYEKINFSEETVKQTHVKIHYRDGLGLTPCFSKRYPIFNESIIVQLLTDHLLNTLLSGKSSYDARASWRSYSYSTMPCTSRSYSWSTLPCKIQHVRWKERVYYDMFVVRLDEFHSIMPFLSAMTKIFEDGGLGNVIL